MAEPTSPRNVRSRSPGVDEAHEVNRVLGLQNRGGGPPPEGWDFDVEEILALVDSTTRGPSRRPAACRPSAPRSGGGTAPKTAGAPRNTPSPPP